MTLTGAGVIRGLSFSITLVSDKTGILALLLDKIILCMFHDKCENLWNNYYTIKIQSKVSNIDMIMSILT